MNHLRPIAPAAAASGKCVSNRTPALAFLTRSHNHQIPGHASVLPRRRRVLSSPLVHNHFRRGITSGVAKQLLLHNASSAYLKGGNTSDAVCRGVVMVAAGQKRRFQCSARRAVVKPYLLADIGEGITECQIIQWFVQPGARVEQFDKICEVQSDKASVEITSRFDGVIKKLHYEADDMAKVGQPLVDIDIQGEIAPGDAGLTGQSAGTENEEKAESISEPAADPLASSNSEGTKADAQRTSDKAETSQTPKLATPAVRHLTKQLNVNLADVHGTGRDGRVLKEDVHRYAAAAAAAAVTSTTSSDQTSSTEPLSAPQSPIPSGATPSKPQTIPLSPVQQQMYKSMTRSLAIPHFLYTDNVDTTRLSELRQRVKRRMAKEGVPAAAIPPLSSPLQEITTSTTTQLNARLPQKSLSPLPFIVKAVSIALQQFPTLNAHLNAPSAAPSPSLPSRGSPSSSSSSSTPPPIPSVTVHPHHNIGIAMSTPAGLLVPIIRHVERLSILEIAAEVERLARAGKAGKLTAADLSAGNIVGNDNGNKNNEEHNMNNKGKSSLGREESGNNDSKTVVMSNGPTFTISNIGSIASGAGVVAPVIVPPQVAILAVGRARVVPRFDDGGESGDGVYGYGHGHAGGLKVVAREECVFSWSADHRVLDGATVAECAEMVKRLVEGGGEELMLRLR